MNASPRYYVSMHNALHGPYQADELAAFITPTTLICREGDDAWHVAGEIAELKSLLADATTTTAATQTAPAVFFARVDEKEYGPYSLEQLKEFVEAATLVSADDKTTWRRAAEIEELAPLFAPAPSAEGDAALLLKDWFFFDGAGERQGPFTRRELDDLLKQETLTEEIMIQHLNWPDPRPLRKTSLGPDHLRPMASALTRRRWSYAAATVAVFLLLLGGILVGRDDLHGDVRPPTPNAPRPGAAAAAVVDESDRNDAVDAPSSPITPVITPAGPWTSGEFFALAAPPEETGDGRLMVKVVDVGQGDGIIIRTPGNRYYIVDAGTTGNAMTPSIERLGIKEIEVMLLTHPHNDHYAGMQEILKRCRVKTFFDAGAAHTSRAYAQLLETVLERDIDYVMPRAGETYDWGDGVKIEILHPDTPGYRNLNDNSIVFRLTYGTTTMLFTGDAEREAQRAILSRHRDKLRADIYKVGHHGSDNATSAEWLDAMRPGTAVISCGLSNRYRHPKPIVVDLLRERKIDLLRTDFMGTITFFSDGASWRSAAEVGSGDRVDRAPPAAPNVAPFSDTAVLSSPDWERRGPEERFTISNNALVITAQPGEEIYGADFSGPLLLHRPLAGGNWMVVAEMKNARNPGTDGVMMLFGDEKNWLTLGVTDDGAVRLVACRKDRQSVENYRQVNQPRYFALERFGDRLNVAVSADRREWFVLCRLPLGKLNFDFTRPRIGLAANAWGNVPARAAFAGYQEMTR